MTKAGFAAVIGAPNAGKSTLVNRLVGSKVSIVTQKAQTTRFAIRGVAVEGDSQIVLVDTPGIFKPRRRLDRAMVGAAWGPTRDADVVVHLVDASSERAGELEPGFFEGLQKTSAAVLLALNKIDLIRRDQLLGLAEGLSKDQAYAEVFMISALDGAGVVQLKSRLAALMPASLWLYPADQCGDLSARLLAAEITREKLYLRVHDELPYAAAVETTAFDERPDGSARIEQEIYVEREGQRAILIGKGGQTLKWIGQASRRELAELLERPVHLFLHVKVKANWTEDRGHYRSLGLDFDA
ncbi:MAG TPA: GTPase Era [Caulobacteraceae bacterium]